MAIFRNMNPEARKMYYHYLTVRIEEMERMVGLVKGRYGELEKDPNGHQLGYGTESYYKGFGSGLSHELFWYIEQRELLKRAEEQNKGAGQDPQPLVYGPDIY